MNKAFIFLTLLMAMSLIFAQGTEDATQRFTGVFCDLYNFLKSILPVAVVVVIILAGIVFALGQVLGAETRARANVWATNMLIMAIIGVVVVILVPWLIDQLVPEFGLSNICE